MKIRMKLVLTALAAGVVGSGVLYGCGSSSSEVVVAPSRMAAILFQEPPSVDQQVPTPSTASVQSVAGIPSTDFETPPGVGVTRRTP
jgi:hypothetical protein